MWMIVSAALAGECRCAEWDYTWEWTPCDPQTETCACACDDTPSLAGTGVLGTATIAGVRCSEQGLGEAARDDQECALAAAECAQLDCSNPATEGQEDTATTPPEEPSGSGCATGALAAGGPAAWLLAAAARRRRYCQLGSRSST